MAYIEATIRIAYRVDDPIVDCNILSGPKSFMTNKLWEF